MGIAKKRIPLNSQFIRLDKHNPSVKAVLTGHFEKMCLDVDMETGEVRTDEAGNELRKPVRVLKFLGLDEIPFQMFETGGLKASREILGEHGPKGVEIVWLGQSKLGKTKNVNDYAIYPLDSEDLKGLTQETAVAGKAKKNA